MGDDSAARPAIKPDDIPAAEVKTIVGQDSDAPETAQTSSKPPTSIWRCVSGSAIAAVLGYGAYNLTFKIATQFASHPLVSDNYIAIRHSGMVRTHVLGISAMATGIFAFAALGLAVLGLQIAFQKLNPGSSASS